MKSICKLVLEKLPAGGRALPARRAPIPYRTIRPWSSDPLNRHTGSRTGRVLALLILGGWLVGSAFDVALAGTADGAPASTERHTSSSLFNEGNARLRGGEVGQAILAYERAQWLAPNDPDIAGNLLLARRQADLPIEQLSLLQRATRRLTFDTWSWLAAGSLFLLAVNVLLQGFDPRWRLFQRGINASMAVALALSVLALALLWPDLDRAVVVAQDAPMRISPVTVIPPVQNLRAGEIVRLKRSRGEFSLVSNDKGDRGWVPREAIALVVPHTAG